LIDGTDVLVNWLAPNNRGSPITRYYIKLIQYDGTSYSEDVVSCDGSDSTIMADLECAVPIATLKAMPFSLEWGTDVYAKVIATNVYGDSTISLAGNGARILSVPDAPENLADVAATTNANQIGLSWTDATEDGGTPVIDYTLAYDQGSGTWITLTSGILTQSYTAIGLETGTTYAFKVLARNAFGQGPYSSSVSILAA
jgi:hypothetical protein